MQSSIATLMFPYIQQPFSGQYWKHLSFWWEGEETKNHNKEKQTGHLLKQRTQIQLGVAPGDASGTSDVRENRQVTCTFSRCNSLAISGNSESVNRIFTVTFQPIN